jgi:hypothetical protein
MDGSMKSDEPMVGDIERFMIEDHARVDALLRDTDREEGPIDHEAFARFRRELLRHIGMEEKVLLPFAKAKRGGEPLRLARAIHADHADIARLLVQAPTTAMLADLRIMLGRHNELEEGPQGLYAACDALAGGEAAAVVERLRAQPTVGVGKGAS